MNADNLYCVSDDNQVIDTQTGEIISLEEIKKAKEQKIIEHYRNMMDDLSDLGLNSKLKLLRYRNQEYQVRTIKSDYTFNKEFRVELREIMKNKELSKNARCFLGTMTPFVSFPSNSIKIDYKNPTKEDLKDLMGMGENVINSTLNELENYQIIRRVKIDGQLVIYVNPFLYCGGYCVEQSTYELFENSVYNTENVRE